MKIELKKILVKDLITGYQNNQEDGVVGYSGKLDIRPKYQREFIYELKQKALVIDTILKGFPLNVMYWVKKDNSNDEYELLDGQQRTMSICEFVVGNNFSIETNGIPQIYDNLTQEDKDKILNYELMIYFCEGGDKEKLEWFETINIAGEKLTKQELRNAIYNGSWIIDAKRYFSKTNCFAYNIGKDYINGKLNRQEYLEIVIDWISKGNIENYMSEHQNDKDAIVLKDYFSDVINWINKLFPVYRKEMKGLPWGELYNDYKEKSFNSNELEEKIKRLLLDEEVTKKSGIYLYLITNDLKYLNLRAFSENQKREVYEKQNGICPICEKNHAEKIKYDIEEMEGDHIIPWFEGGKTNIENCQMLCKTCNRKKSGK